MHGKRILLIGFMGAGKTTAGRIVASRLCISFYDLDDLVSASARMSVPEIFASHGEAAFRAMEAERLESWLAGKTGPAVLALGGGAVESENIRTLLRNAQNAVVVHLGGPLAVLLARCHTDAGQPRPLLAEAEERYNRRMPLYETLGFTLPVHNLSPDEAATQIITMLEDAQ